MKKNVVKVLEALKSNKVSGDKITETIILHPENDLIKDIKMPELDNILIELEREGILKVAKFSDRSRYHGRDGHEIIMGLKDTDEYIRSYRIKLLEKFDEYAKKQLKPHEKNENQACLWITYSDKTREILINDIFILSRPNFNSTNDQVFSYLYKNPNKIITKNELEREATKSPITKRLHDIVQELGFKKDLFKAFYSISKSRITFRNPLSKQDLIDLDISRIRL